MGDLIIPSRFSDGQKLPLKNSDNLKIPILNFDNLIYPIKNSSKLIYPMKLSNPELITNGTFDTDISGWNGHETIPWDTIQWDASGKLHLISDGIANVYMGSDDNISVVSGIVYEVKFDITFSVAGITRFGVVASMAGTARQESGWLSSNGSYSFDFSCEITENVVFQIRSVNTVASNSLIDNISIKKK